MGDELLTQLQASWRANADGWVKAVRGGLIESRRLATDAAIVDTIASLAPRKVLDMGCGEGWLARALAEHGIAMVGVDSSPELLAAAREAGQGEFIEAGYADIVADPALAGGGFDAAVFNFALLDKEAVPVLGAVRHLLTAKGFLVVQTVHPWSACGAAPYRSGWRTESFAGFGDGFAMPMPWYYRTMQDWTGLLRESGFGVCDLREPLHPESGVPLSFILVGRPDLHALPVFPSE